MPRGVPTKPRTPREKEKSAQREKKRQGTPIDWEQLEVWLYNGATGVLCAEAIGIHEKTLYRRCEEDLGMTFAELRSKNRARGDLRLLTTQQDLAFDKNCMMLIWLGKNRLQQRDTPQEIEVSKETINSFKAITDQLREMQEKAKKDE
jgi:hypothetical protein